MSTHWNPVKLQGTLRPASFRETMNPFEVQLVPKLQGLSRISLTIPWGVG
ncbi:hypothetical protein [Ferrithrix thermotolerans]|nr:hypothetical protein [Ferrithrix thermotolerans]